MASYGHSVQEWPLMAPDLLGSTGVMAVPEGPVTPIRRNRCRFDHLRNNQPWFYKDISCYFGLLDLRFRAGIACLAS